MTEYWSDSYRIWSRVLWTSQFYHVIYIDPCLSRSLGK